MTEKKDFNISEIKEFKDVQKERELQDNAINLSLSQIKHKILVMSGKGGVGKSTVAVNLACGLAERGHKVGIMDVDLHGPDIPKMLGLETETLEAGEKFILPLQYSQNLKAVSIASMIPTEDTALIWRGPIKIGIIRQFVGSTKWGKMDYLIIDSPPGTGDEPLTVAQTIPGAKALIVTTPQELALLDVKKSINFCKKVNMPIMGLVENMASFVCPHCNKSTDIFGKGGTKKLSNQVDIPLLASIPLDVKVMQSAETGFVFMNTEKPESAAYEQFNRLIAGVLEKTGN